MQKHISRNILFCFLIFLIAPVYAQQSEIQGPKIVHVNSVQTYNLTGIVENVGWDNISGATILEYSPDNRGITVRWNQVGTFTVKAGYDAPGGGFFHATLAVKVVTPMSGGTITAQKSNLLYGEEMAVIENTIPAQGGFCDNIAIQYAWSYSYDNITFNPVPFSSSPSLKVNEPIRRTTYYIRRATCTAQGESEAASSNVVTISVVPVLTGGVIGNSQIILTSGVPQSLQNITNPSGGTGTFSYQWEQSYDELTWNPVSGATASSYQPPAIARNSFYRRKAVSDIQWRYSNTVRILLQSSASLNKPATALPSPSEPVKSIPDHTGISGVKLNSITQYDVSKPGISDINQVKALTARTDLKKSTVYIDGLGRVLQSVQHQASTSGKDIIDISVYDNYGMQQVKFLPYVASTDGSNTGSFRSDVAIEQNAFYQDLTQHTEDYFYAVNQSEKSELSRINESLLPGINYAGQKTGKRNEFRFNNAVDKIKIWQIADEENAIPFSNAEYNPGKLSVSQSTNEHNQMITDYKDDRGNIICSSMRSGLSDDGSTDLRTYFVYNDLGQLRYIIPPLAVKFCSANNTWDFNATTASQNVAKELCFRYLYNNKGQVIKKQLPGADGAEFFIYDSRGRLVFAQNPLMRSAGQWLLYFYDVMDRPVITAVYSNAQATYASLEALLNTPTGSSTVTFTLPPDVDLFVDKREGIIPIYEATNSITLLPGFETETNAEIIFEIKGSPSPRTEVFQVHNPAPGISNYKILTAIYYDNYNWTGARSFTNSFTTNAGSNPYAESVTPRSIAAGKVTGVRTAVKGKDQMLATTFYYDQLGREVQRHMENIAGGVDVLTKQYDYTGKVLSTFMHHKNPLSSTTPEMKVLTAFTFENGNRLKAVSHSIISPSATSTTQTTSYTYDETGRVKTQTLGNLESLNFDYNLLGQLKGINAGYARNKGEQHYFGTEIFYDRGFEINRKDGGISGVTWRRKGNEDEWHAYGYDYDFAGRLKKADYTQDNGGSWGNNVADFKVSIPAYDENGNIRQMTQDGMLLGNVKASLDNLLYTYKNNNFSNRLNAVTDDRGDLQQGDFKDFNDGGPDYDHDVDGNVIRDRNRGISVTYDPLLNKPLKISFDNDASKSIEYVYSVGGTKLQQIVREADNVTTYNYVNGFIYRNNDLMLFPHSTGRVRRNSNGLLVYDYFIQDQTGNVRTVITEESNIAFYKATHEDSPQPVPVIPEREAFNFPVNPENVPVGHKFYDYAGTNKKFVKLNNITPGNNIGTSKVLRVMAGDVIETGVMSYYAQNSPDNNVPDQPVNQILGQLVNALLGPVTSIIPNGHGNLLQSNSNGTILNTGDISSFINTNRANNPASQVPKAYLNYVLFDDNFKMVSGGALRVSQPDVITPLAAQLNVSKNGYVYIYISNESPSNVYFDDLIVKHTTGHLLQENSYYPYGLTIRALSSKALNRLENKFLFNGIEQISEFDLEIYDGFYRNLDPQTGRWWQRDPESEQYIALSPYHLSGNDPINNSDPLGDDWFEGRGGAKIWLESTSLTEIVKDEVFRNIGTVMVNKSNGLLQLFIGKELSYIGYIKPAESSLFYMNFLPPEGVTTYNKGQQDFIRWTVSVTQNDLSSLMSGLYESKLKSEAAYARGITGGIDAETADRLRKEVNIELIPTLKDTYAAIKSGIDPSKFTSVINPLARANYAMARAGTVFTNDEVKSIMWGTGLEVGLAWALGGNFSNKQYKPSLSFSTAPLPKIVEEAVESSLKIEIGVELKTIDDIMMNPALLEGRTLEEVQQIIGTPEGWIEGRLGKGAHKGQGWVLRKTAPGGGDKLGDGLLQYHPGTKRPDHFNENPYWKVSNGAVGTIRYAAGK